MFISIIVSWFLIFKTLRIAYLSKTPLSEYSKIINEIIHDYDFLIFHKKINDVVDKIIKELPFNPYSKEFSDSIKKVIFQELKFIIDISRKEKEVENHPRLILDMFKIWIPMIYIEYPIFLENHLSNILGAHSIIRNDCLHANSYVKS